ncbi:Fe-S cluster assembly protein SufD [Marinomonas piezotolerans]|uniref:Fe-S cluster assembly protein SufD n=1 Tax=Marinomonas piezotolerans TaxID=2213058 RepID=A0A370U6K2_9GAMM|nr:Fe-S cluster assembly protein SufD [Marinomonas piezotolerans]RDL43395.1 Fe-S cluster assembly protein SufD [Marinomonas piezotolerans]
MSEWLQQAIAHADSIQDGFAEQRSASLALLKDTKWPNRKTEAWKYTPLRAVERSSAVIKEDSPELMPQSVLGADFLELTFVDGQLVALPDELPDGLTITMQESSIFATIKPERHLFGLVNDVLASDIVIVTVAEGVQVEQPIRINNLLSSGAQAHIRTVVELKPKSSLAVVETSEAHGNTLATAFTEYLVGAEAKLEHYRFALQTDDNVAVGGSHFKLLEKAVLNSSIIGFGSQLQRIDTDIIHAGEKADAKLNAIYLLDGQELFDLHATVEHEVPNCTTEENIRGIAADRSRAVFNGRIHIHRDAQKTLAELNNRNLLLSDKAEINTKPELEIYADDVRCAHGATIAEIDKKALYYLQTRGVSKSQAQLMLSFGFINELIDQMPNAELAEWVRPIIRDRFAQMEVK